MLNISPFSYGLIIAQVYDSRSIFSPEILHIKPDDLHAKFQAGVANLAAISLGPHSITNGFKNLLAIASATEVEIKKAAIKEFIKDPSKFTVAVAASAPAAGAGAAAEKKEEAKKEESKSEEDDNMDFNSNNCYIAIMDMLIMQRRSYSNLIMLRISLLSLNYCRGLTHPIVSYCRKVCFKILF